MTEHLVRDRPGDPRSDRSQAERYEHRAQRPQAHARHGSQVLEPGEPLCMPQRRHAPIMRLAPLRRLGLVRRLREQLDRELDARAHAELAVDGMGVSLDRLDAEVQLVGDLPVRPACRDELGDPRLLSGEVEQGRRLA